jgi:DNA helicase II / ATP-dependent DNA helicase PcrA
MALNPVQIQVAQGVQHTAAHDQANEVRVVAGPGTGKSSAIEERVRWLLAQGIPADAIFAVSFTRASALDLRTRVHQYCLQHGQPAAAQVRITTLHSLALRILRAAGLLIAYPADPLVLDTWEVENIFDAEFGNASGIGKTRREKVRTEHEAFWSTGQWGPPNYIPPNPPITAAERAQFDAFHGPRTQCYACVLPGEIVRQCVSHMVAGVIDAVDLVGIAHLVVDEFQDLNPMDLEFVDAVSAQGASVFIAGDDDQSIYSFRFASPAGIQNFVNKYPHCGQHVLAACFRCTPNVLNSSQTLIAANAQPNRIPKQHVSLYAGANPPLQGIVHRWRFSSGVVEATAIAQSCRDLIAAGINPRDVLVLLSNQRGLLSPLRTAFDAAGVAYEPPRAEGFLDSECGRLVLVLVRITCEPNDYVAHRVLLGLRTGVGIGTCARIADAVIANNLNYRSIFYDPIPGGVFTGPRLTALNNARTICTQIAAWTANDTLVQRLQDIAGVITAVLGPAQAQEWQAFANNLPQQATLEELKDLLWADTDEQQTAVLEAVLTRLELPIPPQGVLQPRVRVMTMHGSKGLSAKIVFIPGLEEDFLPGPWRQPYPGLVLEAARMLYVSITRARAACVMSYATTRMHQGNFVARPPSRFNANLAGPFVARNTGLTPLEVQSIQSEVNAL